MNNPLLFFGGPFLRARARYSIIHPAALFVKHFLLCNFNKNSPKILVNFPILIFIKKFVIIIIQGKGNDKYLKNFKKSFEKALTNHTRCGTINT